MFTKTTEYKVVVHPLDPTRQIFTDPKGTNYIGLRRDSYVPASYKKRYMCAQLQLQADKLGIFYSMKMLDSGTMTVTTLLGIPTHVTGICKPGIL